MSGSDDSILARLVELDQKAGELVEQAQEALDETVTNIERDTQEFRRSSAEQSAGRVEALRQQEERASQARLEEISQRYRSMTEALEKTYSDNHAQWEEEIFRRCVGG